MDFSSSDLSGQDTPQELSDQKVWYKYILNFPHFYCGKIYVTNLDILTVYVGEGRYWGLNPGASTC